MWKKKRRRTVRHGEEACWCSVMMEGFPHPPALTAHKFPTPHPPPHTAPTPQHHTHTAPTRPPVTFLPYHTLVPRLSVLSSLGLSSLGLILSRY